MTYFPDLEFLFENEMIIKQQALFIKMTDSMLINESTKFSSEDFQFLFEDESFFYNMLVIQFYVFMKLSYDGAINIYYSDKLKLLNQEVFTLKFLNNISLFSKFNVLNCFKLCLSLLKVPVSTSKIIHKFNQII